MPPERVFGNEEKECSVCARPGLDKHMWMCQNCRDAPSPNDLSTSSSYQCSYACWRQHKSTATSQRLHSTDGCASRQCRIAVGRAAQLLKKLFLIYRSHIYNNPLRVLEIRGDVLYVEDDYEVQPVRRGGNCYPIPQGLSEAHRNAVLLSLMCTDSADWMQPIVQWLLKKLCRSVEEIVFVFKNAALECRYAGDHPCISHVAIKANLPNGQAFIIDMTGSQFGWPEAMVPWKFLAEHRQKRILSIGPYSGPAWTEEDPEFWTDDHNVFNRQAVSHFQDGMMEYLERGLPRRDNQAAKALDLLFRDAESYALMEEDILTHANQLMWEVSVLVDMQWPETQQEIDEDRLRISRERD